MTIESFKDHFVDIPANEQHGKYVTVFIVRKAESECIFRTDGEISNEVTIAGLSRRDDDGEGGKFARVYMSKRKAIAPERRTGRGILRKLGFINGCKINTKFMCGQCIDCRLYGSAVGNEISRKSHVISDEAFSLLQYNDVTDEHTFNALQETGTMRDASGKQSQAINPDEVVRPGAIFLDIETVKDVTMDEFTYILGNIMRTRRYGAMSSRLGKMSNTIIAIAFSNCELFSNLEWTQATYDDICTKLAIPEGKYPSFPVDPYVAMESARNAITGMVDKVHGSVVLLDRNDMGEIIDQVSDAYSDEKKLAGIFKKMVTA
jgi:CRISPR-associated protein Csc2